MKEFNPMKEYSKTVKFCVIAIPMQIILFSLFAIIQIVAPAAKEIKKSFEVSPGPDFTDPRDSKKYKTVKIGSQTWMAQNLDFHGEDGYLGLCYGDEPQKKIRKPENCEKYGRLYDLDEAENACPKGWHLPSSDEWAILMDFAGANDDLADGRDARKIAKKKLKSKSGWKAEENGTDEYGFSALPGGYGLSGGSFYGFNNVGNNGVWRSASGVGLAYGQGVFYYDGVHWNDSKDNLFSVRCLKYSAEVAKKVEREAAEVAKNTSSFTDTRDSKKYKSVKIGSQTWMAENLNFNANGSKCYDNDSGNCAKYGRLYDWATALKACPKGWHLPSKEEWEALGDNAEKLKAKSGWKSGNGTDDYGFSALPGGRGLSNGSNFYGISNYGLWWGASEDNDGRAYYRDMGYYYENAYWDYDYESGLFSVRCLKD